MRLAERYDVICAGGGLSSYLCSALLAKAGKRVLVIDEEDQATARTYGDGYIFDPDFAGFTGLNDTAALGRSLRELGVGTDDFRAADSVIQVLTSNYRLVFSKEAEAFEREVRREVARGHEDVFAFFDLLRRAAGSIPSFVEGALTRGQGTTADASSWRRFWGSYYSKIQSDRPVALSKVLPSNGAELCENLGAAILGAMSYAAPTNLGCEQSMRGLSVSLQGQGFYVGGLDALKKRLATLVLEAGGSVKRDTSVESLITESGKVVGVLLSSFEGIIRSNIVVIGSRLRRLYLTLPENMRDPSLFRSLGRVVPSSWRFTVSLTVKRSVIPIGATSSMTYVGSHQFPLEEENYLKIQIIPDGVYSSRPEGAETATLLVTALVPYRASALDYDYLRRLGGRMIRTLAELMPFLEYNIVSLYPDFRANDAELREAYPFRGPDWLPENLMQYYVRGHRSVQDFWGPSWTTPHTNLYFAGRSVWPSLGTYGEALAARKIFDDVMLPRN